ncbi:MAG: hypothetical protein QXO51_05945 [Halobacteria archaeon]
MRPGQTGWLNSYIGGIGCLLILIGTLTVFLAAPLLTTDARQSAAIILILSGAIVLVGTAAIIIGIFGLYKTLNSQFYVISGIVLSLVLIVEVLALIRLFQKPSVSWAIEWIGWILFGIGLMVTRRAFDVDLHKQQEVLIVATGLLVMTSFTQPIGMFLLMIIFFALSGKQKKSNLNIRTAPRIHPSPKVPSNKSLSQSPRKTALFSL